MLKQANPLPVERGRLSAGSIFYGTLAVKRLGQACVTFVPLQVCAQFDLCFCRAHGRRLHVVAIGIKNLVVVFIFNCLFCGT
jgi:hypothetical protein